MSTLGRAALSAAIASQIRSNGVGAVTGDIVQARLLDIVDSAYNRTDDQGIGGGGGGPSILTRVASAAFGPGTNVVADGETNCKPADPADATQVGTLLGLVALGATQGATVTVLANGPFSSVSGSFSEGMPLYIASDGTLTSARPTSGWLQQVGISSSLSRGIYAPGLAAAISGGNIILPTGGYATPSSIVVSGPVADALSTRLLAPAGAVRKGQFFAALEAGASPAGAGSTAALLAAVPSDPGDATNRAWYHSVAVTASSSLAQFAKTTLGLSTGQLATILTAAASITDY
jgi:hypothetical protein